MTWKWLFDHTLRWKGHLVQEELAPLLEQSLLSRTEPEHNPVFTLEDIGANAAHYDLPGICMTTRVLRTVEVDGLQIKIPSMDWESLLMQARLEPKQKFEDGSEFYKLHGWRFCIVLTPAQRETFLASMDQQRDEAVVEAEADNKRFLEGIRQINQDGVKVVSYRAMALEKAERGEDKNSN